MICLHSPVLALISYSLNSQQNTRHEAECFTIWHKIKELVL